MKDKKRALEMLKERKQNKELTYEIISRETGYERKQLSRLNRQLEEKDMESILTHGNTGRKPVTTASDQEVSYLREFKKPYPNITIAQFRDFYLEDVINSPEKANDIEEYGLKPRSLSWFRELFIKERWQSPAQRNVREKGSHVTHPVRKPKAHRGEMIQIDGSSYDWFQDGRNYTLHLAVDDATTEVLAGYFMPTECTRGYCHVIKAIIEEYGIPKSLYSDKDSVFISAKAKTLSQFGMMMDDLNIRMILANSPEAKGRVERYNGTAQLRLPNDIIRYESVTLSV